MRITAIAASHNRCEHTLKCLASYFGQDLDHSCALDAVLVDDASEDGTAQVVRANFPQIRVLEGTGDLFWAGGMATAEAEAMSGTPDFLLWLNDDVTLDGNALSRLIETAGFGGGDCIAVGAMRDPVSMEITYSGMRRRGMHPLNFELIEPREMPIEVETFHGNVVLIPWSIRTRIGGIDGGFQHAAADLDYGLRATRAGVKCMLAPGTVGTCVRDGSVRPWLAEGCGRGEKFRILFGPKGLPPRPRSRYLARHGGWLWPLFWTAPYIRAAVAIVFSRPSKSER